MTMSVFHSDLRMARFLPPINAGRRLGRALDALSQTKIENLYAGRPAMCGIRGYLDDCTRWSGPISRGDDVSAEEFSDSVAIVKPHSVMLPTLTPPRG